MSGSGNGVDTAAVYQLLSQVAQNVSKMAETVNGHTLLLHEHSRKLNDLEHGQTSLRRTLTQYHASVMGHGILFTELEQRVRRIEEHLNLPPTA
jgi:hypothetical protein